MKKSRVETSIINKPRGIMFHHFLGGGHSRAQGAISAKQLRNIIDYYGDKVLSAEAWYDKAVNNSLEDGDLCLTFDDGLLCQYEIALPVLKEYKLKAFWFIYSHVLTGKIGMLEVCRKFRNEYFKNTDNFYKSFFSIIDDSVYRNEVKVALKDYSHDKWKDFPFYSKNDTKFRFVRDVVLGAERYNLIMDKMIKAHKINLIKFSSDLWVNVEQVKKLKTEGHIIGLHSHTHPTTMAKLPTKEQRKEYQLNFDFLRNSLGTKPTTMSHPCNSYNNETLSILNNLGIKIGFRANMENRNYSKLEFPREDHANVIRTIKK